MRHQRTASVGMALAMSASLAWADGPGEPAPQPAIPVPASEPSLVFTLGGGLRVQPEYFGSEESRVGFSPRFSLHYLRLGPNLTIGDPDPRAIRTGVGFTPSFRYIRERDASEHDELSGLDDIDHALELGFGLTYTQRNFRGFAVMRQGFGGHEGLVGEAGADLVSYPTDRLTVYGGPRVLWGSDGYADTYFGVDVDESAASGLPAHEAGGGLMSAGVELGARYELNERWGIEGAITYDRLMNDAADSPIVEQGSEDQFGARIGLTRTFSFGF